MGNFDIRRRSVNTPVHSFKYSIGLHLDDINMLIFVQKTLGIGKVYTSGNVSYYEVYDLKGISKIIEIFNKHSLNTTKFLHFLDLNKTYELYIGSKKKSEEGVKEIANIKDAMNFLILKCQKDTNLK